MLYVDIPTQSELQALAAARGAAMVSFYVPTTPQTQNIGPARTSLGNLLKQAEAQLQEAGVPKRTIWPISEQIADLIDDDGFWRLQSHSLAVFVTPDSLRTFRLPNRLTEVVQVSDRFHIKPLIRAVSVPQHAFILALAEGGVRVIEVLPDTAGEEIRIPGLPKDAASAAGTASVNSRTFSGRIGGTEGQKVLLRQFCRQVDAALRPFLAGRSEPLILAATEPLSAIYPSVSTYGHLAAEIIAESPAHAKPADLTARARPILDRLHAARLAGIQRLFETREKDGRATTDVAQAARAATAGAVETLLVDIDDVVPGRIDEDTGAVTFDAADSASSYGVVDEIAGRVMASGGQVLGVRREDIPKGATLAAILRYAV